MSDSLFLDPFAQPPSQEPAEVTRPAGDQEGQADQENRTAMTSLTADLPLPPERAVEAFLEYVHLWWPDTLRVCGGDSHVGFEDGSLLEEGLDGGRHRWADVVGIEGTALDLRWFGAARLQTAEPDATVTVTVEFAPVSARQTRVSVRGGRQASCLRDWEPALYGYARFTGGAVHRNGA